MHACDEQKLAILYVNVDKGTRGCVQSFRRSGVLPKSWFRDENYSIDPLENLSSAGHPLTFSYRGTTPLARCICLSRNEYGAVRIVCGRVHACDKHDISFGDPGHLQSVAEKDSNHSPVGRAPGWQRMGRVADSPSLDGAVVEASLCLRARASGETGSREGRRGKGKGVGTWARQHALGTVGESGETSLRPIKIKPELRKV